MPAACTNFYLHLHQPYRLPKKSFNLMPVKSPEGWAGQGRHTARGGNRMEGPQGQGPHLSSSLL